MDTIKEYVKHNPSVDAERIYLAGDSNGGYMTVNMIITYPDYFAAAVPICEAYAYHEYARNADGTELTKQKILKFLQVEKIVQFQNLRKLKNYG